MEDNTMSVGVDQEIDAILEHLRAKMREAGLSQIAIQRIIGWKGSYISQILNRTKALRVEQLLRILALIGLPPWQFFLELSAVTQPIDHSVGLTNKELARKMRESLEDLGRSLERLLMVAEGDDLIEQTQNFT